VRRRWTFRRKTDFRGDGVAGGGSQFAYETKAIETEPILPAGGATSRAV
jgi:hypothetical protein